MKPSATVSSRNLFAAFVASPSQSKELKAYLLFKQEILLRAEALPETAARAAAARRGPPLDGEGRRGGNTRGADLDSGRAYRSRSRSTRWRSQGH